MAERLIGKIQEIKTAARGYRTFNNFRSAILFSRRFGSLPTEIMVETQFFHKPLRVPLNLYF